MLFCNEAPSRLTDCSKFFKSRQPSNQSHQSVTRFLLADFEVFHKYVEVAYILHFVRIVTLRTVYCRFRLIPCWQLIPNTVSHRGTDY